MALSRFEECWPLPTESLPELCQNLNIVFLVDCPSSGNPVHVDHASAVKKKGSSKVCGWISSVWPSWVWESQYASTGNSVFLSLRHSSRSNFHRMEFFPSLKRNFIACRSSKVQIVFLKFTSWKSGFSRVYSNCCSSSSFEVEIIKIGQSSHKMYSNTILNFQESTTILNTCTKKDWKLIECTTYFRIEDKTKC